MTDASRIAPPPMATGIPALFVPPRESGDRTSRRAASPPPRPSSSNFSLTCALRREGASAVTVSSVARAGSPSLRLRRARAASTAALSARAPRPSATLLARSAPKHFRASRCGFALIRDGKKATTSTRRFPRLGLWRRGRSINGHAAADELSEHLPAHTFSPCVVLVRRLVRARRARKLGGVERRASRLASSPRERASPS